MRAKMVVLGDPPQCVLIIVGRSVRGPMPSIQWYSSAKQPPGQRNTGILIFRNAATTSLRMPRVFGIGLASRPIRLVDATAQMLGKMAVDVLVNRVPGSSASMTILLPRLPVGQRRSPTVRRQGQSRRVRERMAVS